MPKGRKKTTPGQKQSITKNALKNFKAWDKQRADKTEKFERCKSKKYWFVSDKGTVVSFYKSEEPIFLHIETNKEGYKYIVTKENGRTKTHYIHRLQAESYNVYAYGKARKYKSLNGLEVHHTEADKRNEPGSEEILEPGTHDELFDKRKIPGINAPASEHYEYMQRVAKVVEENTPDQAVIVFPGTGIVNGEETKDLTQVVYADDFPGVKEHVNQAVNFKTSLKGLYALYVPLTDKDRDLYKQLVETPGEEEKLNAYVLDKYKMFKLKAFDMTYKNIELRVTIIDN